MKKVFLFIATAISFVQVGQAQKYVNDWLVPPIFDSVCSFTIESVMDSSHYIKAFADGSGRNFNPKEVKNIRALTSEPVDFCNLTTREAKQK